MSVGDRLYAIRKDLRLSQKNFAEKLEISLSSLKVYENGTRGIPQEILITLTNLGYNVRWLLTGSGKMKSIVSMPDNTHPFKISGEIPVLGVTAAGSDGFYDEDNIPNIDQAEDFVLRPEYVRDPMAYALQISSINGDSMMPFYKPEDVVVASPMATVVNNDKVIVKLSDGRVLFKIIQFKNDRINLISANPEYDKITIKAADLVFAHKVVGSWGK